MAAFLVTGNPGSGKTTVARELTRLGFIALDADQFAGWQTATGVPASQPELMTAEWLLNHQWVWSRSRLEEEIRTCSADHLFLCGIAVNQREMLDLFELVFLLSIDDATQLDRLTTASNAHRNEAQRAQIIHGRPVFEQDMKSAGALIIDGRQPPPVVASRIVEEVQSVRSAANNQLVASPAPVEATTPREVGWLGEEHQG